MIWTPNQSLNYEWVLLDYGSAAGGSVGVSVANEGRLWDLAIAASCRDAICLIDRGMTHSIRKLWKFVPEMENHCEPKQPIEWNKISKVQK